MASDNPLAHVARRTPYLAYTYVLGRTAETITDVIRITLADFAPDLREYFWRGFFEANGQLTIYAGTGRASGPRSRVTGSYSALESFLDHLDEQSTLPALFSLATRQQLSAGRLTFGADQTAELVRILYNDENLLTDSSFAATAERILQYQNGVEPPIKVA